MCEIDILISKLFSRCCSPVTYFLLRDDETMNNMKTTCCICPDLGNWCFCNGIDADHCCCIPIPGTCSIKIEDDEPSCIWNFFNKFC